MSNPNELLLQVKNVRKAFPGVIALDGVQLSLKAGTVHALMGENGAGKSTLMKIIAGVYTPDQGELYIKGKPLTLHSPLDALNNGIAMIHQELNLMGPMTIAENIWIRREPKNKLGFVNHDEMRQQTQMLFDQLNIELDPEAKVETLSVANRQMVEIAKAVSFNSDVLIMDEPTSALTDREVSHLFRIVHDLKNKGKGIIYITHKMDELYQIADEVSIFRDGQYISSHSCQDVTRDDIIQMMVGREITQMFPKEEVEIGEVVMSIKNLCVKGIFENINFDLHAGEILGFAGLVGSGRSNVAEAIFGVVPATSGSISIHGKDIVINTPAKAMDQGIAFLTEDRKETGCFLNLDILSNMDTAVLRTNYVNKGGFIRRKSLEQDAQKMAQTLRVKTPNLHEIIENLSGGNQQKALLGRWLLTNPKILILDEPTRGIDVGAKAEIHSLVTQLAKKGVAILMISSEMPEVLGMSDRIAVMHEGKLSGIVPRAQANQVKIMELASQ